MKNVVLIFCLALITNDREYFFIYCVMQLCFFFCNSLFFKKLRSEIFYLYELSLIKSIFLKTVSTLKFI